MATEYTSRGGRVTHFEGHHLSLNELKKKKLKKKKIVNNYLPKQNIPPYPQPEFHVSHLRHETGPDGLNGIYEDSGFKGSEDEYLVWFSLVVGPEEIRSAETRMLRNTFPDLSEEEAPNHNFLWKFATSPAFSERSLYGSFRFNFPLQQILDAYSQQFCRGDPPVMRVYKTSVFKQEVQYIVVVHRPDDNKRHSKYPLLEDQPADSICTYEDGQFIWKSQAMCETHNFEMQVGENQIDAVPVSGWPQFYVWDVVSIALRLKPGEVLELSEDQLKNNLTHCEMWDAPYMAYRKANFMDFDEAQLSVGNLWPSHQLKKQTSLEEHFGGASQTDGDPRGDDEAPV
ncbi:unnamed protein product [Ophioblennius macclurei]